MDNKAPPGCVIHLCAGTVGMFGLVSHSYRQAACGARAERWLTTANTNWPEVENVTCKNCMRTKMYKQKMNEHETTRNRKNQ